MTTRKFCDVCDDELPHGFVNRLKTKGLRLQELGTRGNWWTLETYHVCDDCVDDVKEFFGGEP